MTLRGFESGGLGPARVMSVRQQVTVALCVMEADISLICYPQMQANLEATTTGEFPEKVSKHCTFPWTPAHIPTSNPPTLSPSHSSHPEEIL